jgi:hypothetical protein
MFLNCKLMLLLLLLLSLLAPQPLVLFTRYSVVRLKNSIYNCSTN